MKQINRKIIISLILTIFISSLLFISIPVNAVLPPPDDLSGAKGWLTSAGAGMGYQTGTTKEAFIGNIIQAALSLIGILFLILIIIGGYQWMMAGGNEETITKAKKRITNATIGLVVVLGAYILSWEVLYKILQTTGVVPE